MCIGGEHGIKEEEDRILWWLSLDWLHVLAIYSKCKFTNVEFSDQMKVTIHVKVQTILYVTLTSSFLLGYSGLILGDQWNS